MTDGTKQQWRKAQAGDTCVYCGVTLTNRKIATDTAATDEHVIPQTVFLEPREHMVKVPACWRCNHEKSKDDGYFREKLVLDDRVTDHSIAMQIRDGAVMSAVAKNHSVFAREALMHGVHLTVPGSDGRMRDVVMVPVSNDRIQRSFTAIGRGMYFAHTGEVLAPDTEVIAGEIDREHFLKLIDPLIEAGLRGYSSMGSHDEVLYVHVYASTVPNFGFWVISFYQTIPYIVVVRPPGIDMKKLIAG